MRQLETPLTGVLLDTANYSPSHALEDHHAIATLNGSLTHALAIPDHKLHQLPFQQERLTAAVTRALRVEALSTTPHIAPRLDQFFRAISYLSAEHTDQAIKHLNDLAYFGIDPTGVEAVWPMLAQAAQYYSEGRSLPLVHTDMHAIALQRKQTLATLRGHMGYLFGHHATSSPPVIASVYRDVLFSNNPLQHNAEAAHAEQAFIREADQKLAQELKIPLEHVPFSYSWLIRQQVDGLVIPQFDTLVRYNQQIREGKQIHLNCCPNYTTQSQPNGTHVYTFEGLGTDIGLTAQRGFPLLMAMIRRISEMQTQQIAPPPLQIRIGVADFEASEANAKLVGLTINGFKEHLGRSVASMIDAFQQFTTTTNMNTSLVRTNSLSVPIGEWQMHIGNAANISLGAISESYRGTPNYNGERTFQSLVATKRDELEAKARSNKAFQEQLNGILSIRMGIMLRWSDGTEPPLVRQLCHIFDTLTATEFQVPLPQVLPEGENKNQQEFAELQQALHAIVQQGVSPAEKSEAVKKTILRWLKEGSGRRDDQRGDTLTFLQVKVARQGAEDAVMSELQSQLGGGQIVADSSAMWEVFGHPKIAKIVVRGNYEGADK